MSDLLNLMLLNRTRADPLGSYGRRPQPAGSGQGVEPGIRFGRILDGRDLDIETPPTDPYHITGSTRDGWYFEEVFADTMAIRHVEETEVDGIKYLQPATHMCWFPLAEGQLVAFYTRYEAGWVHTLLAPDYSNTWRMQRVTATAGGTAGTLTAAPGQTYDVVDGGMGDFVLHSARSPLNNRTQYGKRIGISSQDAMVAWTGFSAPENCLIFLPAELRSWRADCP